MSDVIYKVAPGHDNAANLEALAFQPAAPEGVQWPELIWGGDGHANYNGQPFMVLKYAGGIDEADRNEVIEQFGLSDSLSAPVSSVAVTMQIPDNTGEAIIVNCTASLPERKRRELGFYTDFDIILTELEEI